ncbi:MAG TPA: Coq4 family protein, partial [Kofleriaceae bacterium]
ATTPTTTDDLASLSPVLRWKRALSALRKILADPERTDQVLEFLRVINSGRSTSARIERFFADPAARKLYDEHRAIDSRTVDLDALTALPEGTLGHAYATFLRARGLTPEVFDGSPPGIRDPRLSYVVQRMRQTHDLWHVVTGCNTDPAGEIALQAFTFAQTRAPGNAILAVTGALRGVRQKPGIVCDMIALYRRGKRANRLVSFAWEDHWATPLAEVRAMLGLPVVPPARAAA